MLTGGGEVKSNTDGNSVRA